MDIVHWDLQLGTLLVASWMNATLLTLEYISTWTYFTTYPEDGVLIKLTVTAAVLADTISVMSSFAICYLYQVTHFGDVEFAVSQPVWFPIFVTCTGIASFISQIFLTSRIVRLSKTYWWAVLLVPCCIAGLVGAIGSAIGLKTATTLAQRGQLLAMVVTWLSSSAGTDVLLAAILIFLLRRIGTKSDFEETSSIIKRISLAALRQGAITASWALMALLLYEVSPLTNLDVVFSSTLGRIATLTLLSNLCARNGLRSSVKGRTSSGRTEKHGGITISRHVAIDEDHESEVGIELGKAPSYTSPVDVVSPWDNRSKTASDSALV